MAAWAGLQDSVPRAAVLSLHARIRGVTPGDWDHASLVQVWGPRFSAFVVPAEDHAIFTVGRHPERPAAADRAEEMAQRLANLIGKEEVTYRDAGERLGVDPNMLRYASTTGRVLIRWEGAGKPTVRIVDRPSIGVADARKELLRRFLHLFAPSTPQAFGAWAGMRLHAARAVFQSMEGELVDVVSPLGNSHLLADDVDEIRHAADDSTTPRLLPSGDPFYLLWGDQRELLVREEALRGLLWTPRVWPGALLVGNEVTGTWRRSGSKVTIDMWADPDAALIDEIVAEAESLPLPDSDLPVQVQISRLGLSDID